MFHLQTSAARVADMNNSCCFTRKNFKLFCLLIALLFVSCDNTAFPVKPDELKISDGRFVGRNSERLVIVFTVEKTHLIMFNYDFYDEAGRRCRGGSSVGSASEPITRIVKNEFTIARGNNLVFRGKFSTNDNCNGTWEGLPDNVSCYESSGMWVVTRS